jgi:acyl-coenzyme A synthetase/AMP-(fatty) acid ligase
VLNAFTAIARSAVVGRPESDGNEEVVAFVELRHGAALDAASLQTHLKENLAPYKRPAVIRTVTEFPMTGSGKVLKRKLLELHPG